MMKLLVFEHYIGDEHLLHGFYLLPDEIYEAAKNVAALLPQELLEYRPQGSNLWMRFDGVSDVLDHYIVRDVSFRDAIGISRGLAKGDLCWGANPLDRYLFENESEHPALDMLFSAYSNFMAEWKKLIEEES